DVEVRSVRPGGAVGSGAEHLDRLADVVARYSDRPGADAAGLLAYLDAAAIVENGLSPAEVGVAPGRVQVLTVHAAKGLEWQIVAVPHLSARVFPSTASKRTWLTDASELPPLLRGDRAGSAAPEAAGGGLNGVPVLDTSAVNDRKALEEVIDTHRRQLLARSIDEERRLLYVALTRAEDTLLLSGHHWGATESTPRGPSDFLCEIRDVIADSGCGEIEHWESDPADGEPNPLRDNTTEALWPVDPLGSRRGDIERGAQLVAEALAGLAGPASAPPSQPVPPAAAAEDPHGWIADVDALLAERARAAEPAPLTLPAALSVSALVELDRDRNTALRRLTRRLPARPDPHALLGTAFHDWVQRFYGAERLFDLDDLPGAGDPQTADAEQLAALQDSFNSSTWAARTPLDVEVPFELVLGDTVVRGRIDAVFPDSDGGVTVVDWKTGEPPADEQARRHAAVQLAVYRLAWAGLSGCPVPQVRAAFHYVRAGRTVTPEKLYGAAELAELLNPDAERCAGSPAHL
ncbi:MAG: 3'-5' exonuclease, partial [Mycobacteriaceae bacterium]